MDILNHIGKISLFEELPIEHRKALASLVADETYKRGGLIFSEGDEGTGFFVIITGRVKIFKLISLECLWTLFLSPFLT